MSTESDRRSHDFLKISDQFKLGILTTECSHPVTANLSEVAKSDTAAALGLLFQVDQDVLVAYERFVLSGRFTGITETVLESVRGGGRVFFTGCGATGRLSIQLVSMWREFWQRYAGTPAAGDFEQRALSVMAGGDFALIKSVEGFEDYTAFGRKQIADLGVREGDVVFAITEGGETSFVIGTAWQGLEAGAKVYFVYNNPDEILCSHVERSREVIQESRIEKINLTTGPMAITGSTRIQATSIQLCVLSTVLEMVVRELLAEGPLRRAVPTNEPLQRAVSTDPDSGRLSRAVPTKVVSGAVKLSSKGVPEQFLSQLREVHRELISDSFRSALARLVELEEQVYRGGGKVNYVADHVAIDLLTDTTERSPTYCTPPFRKADDSSAAESWAFLFVPQPTTAAAWEHILHRDPRCVEWSLAEIQAMLEPGRAARSFEVVKGISRSELLRFKVGLDGLPLRALKHSDAAIAVIAPWEAAEFDQGGGVFRPLLDSAQKTKARAAAILLVRPESKVRPLDGLEIVSLRVPETDFLLDPVSRVGLKMLLNALSTCIMVRLGRVMGNYMVWVVPSNLKLIDRATRYVQRLSGLDYAEANRLLFEVIEYIDPRMQAGRAYPPAVAMAVTRQSRRLGNEEAEELVTRGAPRL